MVDNPMCYTVSLKEDLPSLDRFSTVQFTLNHRVFPSKRKSAQSLIRICKRYPNVKVICHYDFVYIASKYVVFSDSVKQAIVQELLQILNIPCPNFLGVVMHTDSAIKTSVKNSLFPEQLVYTEYNSRIYNLDKLSKYVHRDTDCLEDSLRALVYDISPNAVLPLKRIYLENTVKTPTPVYQNPLSYLYSLCDRIGYYGVCYDSEHLFASSGCYLRDVLPLDASIPTMVHLNTVPFEVKSCSRLDRHSDTTIFECSQYKSDVYYEVIEQLNILNVPFVREVKMQAREREIEQWQNQ